MDYIRINTSKEALLNVIRPLYEQSFPEKERRDFSQLQALLEIDNMYLTAVKDASLIVGFLIQWEFEKFNYIEHFAIDPSQRGMNYGSAIMKHIINNSLKTLLLEVEPAQDEIGRKRIVFYERLGMKICRFDYEQPPYRKSENSIPMLMMSYPQELAKQDFEEFTSIIKAEVYGRWK